MVDIDDEMTPLVVELKVELCGTQTADEASKHATIDVPCVVMPIFDVERQGNIELRAEVVKSVALSAIWHSGTCDTRLRPL
jgi:hypothetical protein